MSAILKSSPLESFFDLPHLSVSFNIQDGGRTLVSLFALQNMSAEGRLDFSLNDSESELLTR